MQAHQIELLTGGGIGIVIGLAIGAAIGYLALWSVYRRRR